MKFITKFVLLWLSFSVVVPLCGEEPETNPGKRWIEKMQQQELQPFQIEAYRQLSLMHTCRFQQIDHRGSFFILSFAQESTEPMDVLASMGLKVLPILSEALTDVTASQTVTVAREKKRVWKVNELIALLIRRLGDREFVIGEWGTGVSVYYISEHPELQIQFQKLILTWYENNKDRTEEKRKIADLKSNLRNRSDAMIWLGKHRSTKAAPLIAKRIEKILNGEEVSSSTQYELAEAALSLGLIGDVSTLPAIAKACEHLSFWNYMSYRPMEQGRSSSGSGKITKLFKSYHGMALLGQKQEAVSELKRLFREYSKEMEDSTRDDYEVLLKKARGWKEKSSGKKSK